MFNSKEEAPPQVQNSNPWIYAMLRFFSLGVGYLIIIVIFFVLMGWAFGNEGVKATMEPLTACGLLLAGISLVLLAMQDDRSHLRNKTGRWLAISVLVLGCLLFLATIMHMMTGIQIAFFYEKLDGTRVAVWKAVNFAVIGSALYALGNETRRKWRPSEILSLVSIFMSLFMFLGQSYGVWDFFKTDQISLHAILTTFFFIMLPLAVLCLRPNSGLVMLIATDDVSGKLARSLLPAALIVPALVGMCGLLGYRYGLYNHETLLLIVTVTNMIIFTGLVWWSADTMHTSSMLRKAEEDTVRQESLTDQLTGLYNRRGFQILADQQIKIAKRDKQMCILFFADLDGLKRINDSFGHKEGDQALIHTAEILKNSFRASDIIARFAGDEFAVLGLADTVDSVTQIAERLEHEIKLFQSKSTWLPYQLSFSVGVSFIEAESATVEKLMLEADKKLYEIKRKKK